MGKIVSVHSFGGTPIPSSLAANLAVAIARLGLRVGVIDTGDRLPRIHTYFGLEGAATDRAWNDYVWKNEPPSERLNGAKASLPIVHEGAGEVVVMGRDVYLVPFTATTGDVSRLLEDRHDVEPLKDGIHTLVERLALDCLFIDTHPGTTEETVFSIAISDTLLIVLRPDKLDFQGTAVTVDLARRLSIPKILLLVDGLPPGYDETSVHEQVEHTYNAVVVGVLPADPDVAAMAGNDIFCRRRPEHPWSKELERIARQIIA